MLKDPKPFAAVLKYGNDGAEERAEAIEVRDGFVAFFPPRDSGQFYDAELELEVYTAEPINVSAAVRFLRASPSYSPVAVKPVPDAVVLLTNGRGGMARLPVDVGRVNSKYDCALGANLNPDFPVDRHILVKRLRVWISADGFITALNLQNLASVQGGPPAVWNFVAEAGDGRTVELQMTADMIEGSNTTVFTFTRLPGTRGADLPQQFDVRITVRVDIEDRNFHTETHRNDGAEFHFRQHCHTLDGQIGFAFTPASDRQLRVLASAGDFHPEPEWCQGIPHPVEQSRAQVGSGDAYSPGWFEIPLVKGHRQTVVLSAEIPAPGFDVVDAACRQSSDGGKVGIG